MFLGHQNELSKEERANIWEYLGIEERKTPEYYDNREANIFPSLFLLWNTSFLLCLLKHNFLYRGV
jgi:hypothetical protein